MKEFRFRLQRVLRWRTSEARLARVAYGRAVARAREVAAELETVRFAGARLEASLGLLRERLPGSAGALRVVLSAIDRLEEDEKRVRAALEEAEEAGELARLAYLERNRDQRALEALQDRRALEHSRRVLFEEAKAIDEVARDRFLRVSQASKSSEPSEP